MTAKPSVRDRAARIVALTLQEGVEGLWPRADGIADALAAAGLLAGERQVAMFGIDDQHVIDLARAWQNDNDRPGVVRALVSEGIDEGLAVNKIDDMAERDLLEYGTSPYYAWPTS